MAFITSALLHLELMQRLSYHPIDRRMTEAKEARGMFDEMTVFFIPSHSEASVFFLLI